jgi:hypothetical protein
MASRGAAAADFLNAHLFTNDAVFVAARLACVRAKLSERHGLLTQPAAEIATQSLAPPPARRMGAGVARVRSVWPCWPCRGPGAAQPHAPPAPRAGARCRRRRPPLAPPDLRAPRCQLCRRGRRRQLGSRCGRRSTWLLAVRDPPPSRAWERELPGRLAPPPDGATSGPDRGSPACSSANGSRAATPRRSRGGRRSWAAAPLSWLSHAALLLDGAEPKRYAAVMHSLTDQITYLSTAWQVRLTAARVSSP